MPVVFAPFSCNGHAERRGTDDKHYEWSAQVPSLSGGKVHTITLLALAETVADPNRALWHCVAAELQRKIGHVVQVELRTDEQMLCEKKLNADTRMHLKMVRTPYRLGHVGAHGGPYARIL